MPDIIQIRLAGAEKTQFAASSLCSSLYHLPITLRLYGDLGAGKTTFVQAFGQALGLTEAISSPTFAIEQRYKLPVHQHGLATVKPADEFVHMDLYRLNHTQVEQFLHEHHQPHAIACIEWAEKLPEGDLGPNIALRFDHDSDTSRTVTIEWNDIALPTDEEIATWREEVAQPPHIIDHCEAVTTMTEELSSTLAENGHVLRLEAVKKAAQLHDLLRFLDFHAFWQRHDGQPVTATGGGDIDETQLPAGTIETWQKWREEYPDVAHEQAAADFLTKRGYAALGHIIAPHGFNVAADTRVTTEQKLLFYADKRVKFTEVVSLEERFADFNKRYGNGKPSPESLQWQAETEAIEQELFPEGPPPTTE